MLLDRLAEQYGGSFSTETRFHGLTANINVANTKCWLLKPTTFMNKSGSAVQALAHFYKIPPEHIIVAHDELDLECGIARIKQNGGHGGHNGLRDIIQLLGERSFLRLRIGIGHPGQSHDVVNYVLSKAGRDDSIAIKRAIDNAVNVIPEIIRGDLGNAMQTLHTRTDCSE